MDLGGLRPPRPGATRRRGCSPARRRARRERAAAPEDVVVLLRAVGTCRSLSARCRTSACRRWRSAGAGTGAARSCAISAAGSRPRQPARRDRAATACWPRRSSGRRPTPSPSWGRPARPAGARVAGDRRGVPHGRGRELTPARPRRPRAAPRVRRALPGRARRRVAPGARRAARAGRRAAELRPARAVAAQRRAAPGQRRTSSSGSRPSTSASTAATSARSSTSRTPSWRPRRARPTRPSSSGTSAPCAS